MVSTPSAARHAHFAGKSASARLTLKVLFTICSFQSREVGSCRVWHPKRGKAGAARHGRASCRKRPLWRRPAKTGDAGSSPILGTARRAGGELAALVNGSFGHALDYDDVLSMMPAHPSAVIIPALIADLATRPLSGRALIEAQVMGIEVGDRKSTRLNSSH